MAHLTVTVTLTSILLLMLLLLDVDPSFLVPTSLRPPGRAASLLQRRPKKNVIARLGLAHAHARTHACARARAWLFLFRCIEARLSENFPRQMPGFRGSNIVIAPSCHHDVPDDGEEEHRPQPPGPRQVTGAQFASQREPLQGPG